MILHDKVGDHGIISLKVNFDGSINYEATCDQFNENMDEISVTSILGRKAEAQIVSMIDSEKIQPIIGSGFNIDELVKNLNSLLDSNDYQEIYKLLFVVNQVDTIGNFFLEVIENIITYSLEKNKLDNVLSTLLDLTSSFHFDSPERFKMTYIRPILQPAVVKEKFMDLMLKKCLDRGSHVRYVIAF